MAVGVGDGPDIGDGGRPVVFLWTSRVWEGGGLQPTPPPEICDPPVKG